MVDDRDDRLTIPQFSGDVYIGGKAPSKPWAIVKFLI